MQVTWSRSTNGVVAIATKARSDAVALDELVMRSGLSARAIAAGSASSRRRFNFKASPARGADLGLLLSVSVSSSRPAFPGGPPASMVQGAIPTSSAGRCSKGQLDAAQAA